MAEKAAWKKEYELGIPQIDEQHKKLVEIAGKLYDALNGDAEKYEASFEGILKEFGDYTVYHFSTEEALIEKEGYPSLSSHKLAHQNFIMELNNQNRKLAKESADPIADGFRFYDYVLSWLLTHIAKADRLWADFIAKKK